MRVLILALNGISDTVSNQEAVLYCFCWTPKSYQKRFIVPSKSSAYEPVNVPTIILINGQFPGPRLDVVTNDNIVLNFINKFDQLFLLTWTLEYVFGSSWCKVDRLQPFSASNDSPRLSDYYSTVLILKTKAKSVKRKLPYENELEYYSLPTSKKQNSYAFDMVGESSDMNIPHDTSESLFVQQLLNGVSATCQTYSPPNTYEYTHGRANANLCHAAFNPAPTTTDGCLSSSPSVGSDISSRFPCPNTLPIPNTSRSDNSCPTTAATTYGPSRTLPVHQSHLHGQIALPCTC
ncbi:L-ascorbate oxidase [Tanacetum coccineum]